MITDSQVEAATKAAMDLLSYNKGYKANVMGALDHIPKELVDQMIRVALAAANQCKN